MTVQGRSSLIVFGTREGNNPNSWKEKRGGGRRVRR